MSDPLLSVENLQVELGGLLPVRDVTFAVDKGACIGLVGETGCGKSMTCRAIVGLLHRVGARASRGKILFAGTDLLRLSTARWRDVRGRGISFVPQSSLSSLNPVRRVGNQLRETISALDAASDVRARALELLDQVHIDRPAEALRLYPHELSGGMRQRVMIALALAGRPQLLVADEPTTALDVTVQREILALLREIRDQTGMALILVTHDLGVVKSVADSVAVMYAGMIAEIGPARRVIEEPGHPYTRALLGARPVAGSKVRLAAIPGSPPVLGQVQAGCPFAPRCEFAVATCTQESPALGDVGADHRVACWRADEMLDLTRSTSP